MIVNNFNLECVAIPPLEANAPAVIDTYAVLPFSVTAQRLQPIAGWDGQIVQMCCGVEHEQLASGRPLDGTESSHGFVLKQAL